MMPPATATISTTAGTIIFPRIGVCASRCDATRRRSHEFWPDWIADCFTQNSIDFCQSGCIEVPTRHFVNRPQLIGVTRAPQRRCDALIEHPADSQVNDALAKALLSESIEFLHSGQILSEPGFDEFRICASQIVAAKNGIDLHSSG